ncbi:hypothetical protein B0H12DRAFT_33564 [Mycena haematopus]|nr:hypothetical protein B0H12DRAFT_33564 [Mycena haematopus]
MVEVDNPLNNKKMCTACREKHRGYASTKRARRKAEKTLVNKVSSTSESAGDADPMVPSLNQVYEYKEYKGVGRPQAPAPWVVDPALYSQHAPSSSSTLAGALTLPPSTNTRAHVSTAPPPVLPSVSDSTNTTVSTSGAETFSAPTTTGGPIPPNSEGQTSDVRPRFCSVKGCKAIIVESIEVYPYKMCQPCRNRYRNYGITKRAKWKSEREAFLRELEVLRVKEDERRASNGLPPLSEDELGPWELSIIDEQVPLPPGDPSTSEDPLATPPEPLPDRMCTVSHCHNLLPGSYRFKRCETHRIQNRWHSKLKRGREKIEKGFMLPDGTLLVTPGPIRTKKIDPKDKNAHEKKDAESNESPSGDNSVTEGTPSEQNGHSAPDKPIPRRSRSAYSCREDDCCNLILPGMRWRSCESCRERAKALKQEKRAAERGHVETQFVNMTVDASNPAAGPSISTSAPSTANVPTTGSGESGGSANYAPAVYPPSYTSTSALLTVNEPPSEKNPQENVSSSGVKLVRKYRKWPRYDKDGNPINAEASSSTTQRPAAPSTAPILPTTLSPTIPPTPGVSSVKYSYPPQNSYPPRNPYPTHNPYSYYQPSYYGMPPPSGSAPGQPPMMFIPYPYPHMPPSDRPGSTPGPPTLPYPYYPYPIPGYGLPPRANYAYPTSPPFVPAGGYQSPYQAPYAGYQPQPTPAPTPAPSHASAPPLASLYSPSASSQGYYYRYRVDLKKPAPEALEEQPNKRRRLSEENTVHGQQENESPVDVPRPPEDAPAIPPPDARATPDEAAVVDAEIRDEQPQPSASSQSFCAGKTCSRALPTGTSSLLCEKCRSKMKRRQATTKQRFKLEPKKILAVKSAVVAV